MGEVDAPEDEALLTRSLLTADGTAALDADSPQQSLAPSVPSSHDMATEAALEADDSTTGTYPCLFPDELCMSICLGHWERTCQPQSSVNRTPVISRNAWVCCLVAH